METIIVTLASVFILLFITAANACATNKDNCIVINDVIFCEKEKEEISLGGVEIKVKNPFDLLRKARANNSGKLKKTGLYDDYNFIPLIEELAMQNDMSYHEFIKHMADHWSEEGYNPFRSLLQLEELYDELPLEYRELVIDEIADQVAADVINEILRVFGDIENV